MTTTETAPVLAEAIWDLLKMALLATIGAQTYLITGATPRM